MNNKRNTRNNLADYPSAHPQPKPLYALPLTVSNVRNLFLDCSDFVTRDIFVGLDPSRRVGACWIDGLVSGVAVSEDVIRPLILDQRLAETTDTLTLLDLIMGGGLYSYSVRRRDTVDEVITDIVNGFSVLIFDDVNTAISFEARTPYMRGVEKPTIEKSVKGAKDSFVETFRMSTSLVRRKLRSPKLKEIDVVLGRKSGTIAAIMYMEGIAPPELVENIKTRLEGMDVDGVLNAGNLEEYLIENPDSPLPQFLHTERPDKFSDGLLAGQVGILVDGIPIGFMLPATFADFFHVPQDSAYHYSVSAMLSILRWFSLIISLCLPAFFVAISMYHQEMLPTQLLLSMISAKQKVPFGVAIEVVTMLIAFELLQEAGLRLPDPIGQTVSIIGALIVGQSAIEARIVSPIAVIVVAFAGISGYTIPSQDMSGALRIFRFLFIAASICAGLFGLVSAIALLILHLSSIESYGLAYTSPFTDHVKGLKRAILRSPLRDDKFRNTAMNIKDKRKQK